jgi:peptidoglycan/LPS O-acetylase OafA/YrhL
MRSLSGEAEPQLQWIEALRFVCAAAIIIWHYQLFFFIGAYDDATAPSLWPQEPFYFLFWPLYRHGVEAVQAFWLISGYIFFYRYADAIRTRRVGLYAFAAARFSRLYPLHIVTLMLVAAGQYLYATSHGGAFFIYQDNSAGLAVTQAIFASNWFGSQPYSFNGPIWSVSVEVLIYAVFFTSVLALARRLSKAETAIALTCAFYAMTRLPIPHLSASVKDCGLLFFMGGCAACLFDAARLPIVRGLSMLAKLGGVTYSSYLLHFPMQLAAAYAVDAARLPRSVFLNPIAFLSFIASVFALSFAVNRWFEAPVRSKLRALLMARRTPPSCSEPYLRKARIGSTVSFNRLTFTALVRPSRPALLSNSMFWLLFFKAAARRWRAPSGHQFAQRSGSLL